MKEKDYSTMSEEELLGLEEVVNAPPIIQEDVLIPNTNKI